MWLSRTISSQVASAATPIASGATILAIRSARAAAAGRRFEVGLQASALGLSGGRPRFRVGRQARALGRSSGGRGRGHAIASCSLAETRRHQAL